ncbi:MAG: deoxyribodipyrimidine photo-lyase, partial [Bacteroidales bacterium]|nr:deoxyribodipyrimidine photo-lyase [Bacteroidales bacterium]
MNTEKFALVWLRRDLRASDNKALEAAVASGLRVVPVFVFDPGILELLPDREDRRVEFIIRSLRRVESELGPILCFYGRPADVFEWLIKGGWEDIKVDRNKDRQE